MRRRPKWFYRPGLHLALHTETGYRPAIVLEDGGGRMVKVRYLAHGSVQEHWVYRTELVPPPWAGPRHP